MDISFEKICVKPICPGNWHGNSTIIWAHIESPNAVIKLLASLESRRIQSYFELQTRRLVQNCVGQEAMSRMWPMLDQRKHKWTRRHLSVSLPRNAQTHMR
jgi:hypothetical protein